MLAAANSVDRKIVILLGGLDKGMDFSPLEQLIPRLRGAVLYGESAAKIHAVLKDKTNCICCKTDFAEVFRAAVEMAEQGDCIMLSPACASMDMFKNYQERGDRFCELFQQL